MNRPTLEEVKEHFKDAKIIKDHYRDVLNTDDITSKGIYEENGFYYCDTEKETYSLWTTLNGYAEIVEYKETRPERYSNREVNGMDVIDLVKHWNLNFNEGNILKYLLRDKGEDLEDMQKIIDYATREYKHLN